MPLKHAHDDDDYDDAQTLPASCTRPISLLARLTHCVSSARQASALDVLFAAISAIEPVHTVPSQPRAPRPVAVIRSRGKPRRKSKSNQRKHSLSDDGDDDHHECASWRKRVHHQDRTAHCRHTLSLFLAVNLVALNPLPNDADSERNTPKLEFDDEDSISAPETRLKCASMTLLPQQPHTLPTTRS